MRRGGRLILGLLYVLAGISLAAAQNVTFCWGNGNEGQLGNGITSIGDEAYNSSVPVQVAGSQSFASVCTGLTHSCALEPSGKAWCWGGGERDVLGAGSTSTSLTPVAVSGGHTFRSITCGTWHTCALDDQSKAWCWGWNYDGHLVTSTTADILSTPVEAAPGRTFRALSAGPDRNCGLDADGRAICWGEDREPFEVVGGHTFAVVAPGGESACALEPPPSYKAWCWAWYNVTSDIINDPLDVPTPMPVPGNHEFTSISTGSNHSCAIDTTGDLWCWGAKPGNGQDNDVTAPVRVGKGRTFLDVSASYGYTCALDVSGDIVCLGGNWEGELGIGVFNSSVAAPTSVAGGHTFLALGMSSNSHTCAIATKQSATGVGQPSPPTAQPSPNPAPLPWPASSPPESPPAQPPPSPAPLPSPTTSPYPPPAPLPHDSSAPPTGEGASPSPPPPATTTTTSSASSSGSVPMGAIAGGAAAAAAVLAVLAFFALRPGKGWLRRTPPAVSSENGSDNIIEPLPSSKQCSVTGEPCGWPADGSPLCHLPGQQPSRPAASGSRQLDTLLVHRLPTGSMEGPDTLLPYSRSSSSTLYSGFMPTPLPFETPPPNHDSPVGYASPGMLPGPPLPPSNTTSGGLDVAASPAAGTAGAAAHPSGELAFGQATSRTSSTFAPADDNLLSFISSHLGTQAAVAGQLQTADLEAVGATSRSGSNSSMELRTHARLWEVQWAELSVMHLLGRGSFGSVYLAEWSHTCVAVKVLIGKDHVDRGELQLPHKVLLDLQAEAAVMSHMRHPNVVQFMGLVAVPPSLITEYCSNGSLYDCLAAARKQAAAAAQLTWHRRLVLAADAGTGLCYLHRRGIIHRDVKSPNLLIDEAWRVKVADFNLSKILVGARPESSITAAGLTNPIWAAPEVLEGGRATAASDVYSFGMVLFELLTWRLPWSFVEMSPFKVGATIMTGGRPEVPQREELPGPDTAGWTGLDVYVQLMRDCWAQRPEDRPTFDEVVGRLRQLLGSSSPTSPA